VFSDDFHVLSKIKEKSIKIIIKLFKQKTLLKNILYHNTKHAIKKISSRKTFLVTFLKK